MATGADWVSGIPSSISSIYILSFYQGKRGVKCKPRFFYTLTQTNGMKNRLPFLALLFLVGLSATAQDLEKISRDFQQAMNDTVTAFGRNKMAGKFYPLRGINMYCEIYGQGEPLLLIHGNSGSINNFAWQIPYFSKKYRVIVADSRAQGRSADNGDSLSYEMMADDYAALLDQLNIDSA